MEELWQAVVLQTHGPPASGIVTWGGNLVAGFQDGALKISFMRPITALGVDNIRLISASQDGALRAWGADGHCIRVIPFGEAPISALLMLSPRLYTAHERDVRVSSAGSYAQLGWLRGHESDVTCLSYWNGRLVSGSMDHTVRVWKLPIGECERVLRGHTDVVTAVVSWGVAVASSSWDRTVRVWAPEDEKSERVLTGHRGKVLCLAVHAGLEVLFSGAADRTVRMWSTGGECVKIFDGWFSATITTLCVDGQLLLAGSQDGAFGGWRIPTTAVHNHSVVFVRPKGASPFSPSSDPTPSRSPRTADPKAVSNTPPPSSLGSTRSSGFSATLRSLAAPFKSEREKAPPPAAAKPAPLPNYWAIFVDFIRRGDAAGLRDALTESGVPLTQVSNEAGSTLLHVAAADGHLQIVRMLVSRNLVNATDRSGWTPLLSAAAGSHLAVCRILLDNHASASASTSTGSNALHLLCRAAVTSAADKQELLDVMGMLMTSGADVNQRNIHGLTPLHEAAAWGRAEVAYLLLDAGADPMVVSKLNETPIQVAMRKSLKDVVVVIRSRLTAEQRASLPDENRSAIERKSSSSQVNKSPTSKSPAANSLESTAALSIIPASPTTSVLPVIIAPSPSPPPVSIPTLHIPKSGSNGASWMPAQRRLDDDNKSPPGSPSISPRGSHSAFSSDISPRSRLFSAPDFAYALMPPLDAPADTRSNVFTTAIAASAALHLASPRGPGAMRVAYNGVASRLPDGAPQPARLVIFTRRAVLMISTSGAMLPELVAPRLAAEHRSRLSVIPWSPDYTQLSIAVERLQMRNDAGAGAVEIFDSRSPDQGRFIFRPAENQRDLPSVLAERSAAHRAELLFGRGLVALHDGILVFLRNLQTKSSEFTTPPTLMRTFAGLVTELEALASKLAPLDAEPGLRTLDEKLSQHERLVALFCEFYTNFPSWLRAYLPDELGDIPLRYVNELADHVRQAEAVRYPSSASLLSQLGVLEEQLSKLSRSVNFEPIRSSRRSTIIRPQFAYVVVQKSTSFPGRSFVARPGDRGIILNDSEPHHWCVRFTQSNGDHIEVLVPADTLFRVTKEICI